MYYYEHSRDAPCYIWFRSEQLEMLHASGDWYSRFSLFDSASYSAFQISIRGRAFSHLLVSGCIRKHNKILKYETPNNAVQIKANKVNEKKAQ